MIKMMMTGGIMALGCASALADPGEYIVKQAQKCWAVTNPKAASAFSADVEARIEADGRTFFRVNSYEPQNAKILFESMLRALDRCAPYTVPAGQYHFTMTFADPFKP